MGWRLLVAVLALGLRTGAADAQQQSGDGSQQETGADAQQQSSDGDRQQAGITDPGEAGARPKTIRTDGLAALVGGLEPAPGVDTILRSDVELYALIELGGDTSGPLPKKPLPLPLLRRALEKLVGEHIIAREAQRVRVSEPRSSDVARERRRLERRAGGRKQLRELLRELGVSKRELETILLRRARVAAFLKANLEAPPSAAGARPDRKPSGAGQGEDGSAGSQKASLEKAAERMIRLLMVRTPVRVFGEYAP